MASGIVRGRSFIHIELMLSRLSILGEPPPAPRDADLPIYAIWYLEDALLLRCRKKTWHYRMDKEIGNAVEGQKGRYLN